MSCSRPTVHIPLGSSPVVTFDLTPRLASGELLTGTPVVQDVDSTGELTLASAQINTVADDENDIAISKAVQFQVSTTSTTCKEYNLKLTASSDGIPAQTLVDYLTVSFHN